jgi:homoserine dehydrogenase
LFQRVQPCLVPREHPLAAVDGPTNAVVVEGNFSGRLLFQGAGAGDGPTASAVVADLIDIARGDTGLPFSVPVSAMEALTPPIRPPPGRDYLRFTVADRPACSPRSPPRCAMPGSRSKPDPAGPARGRRRGAGRDGHPRTA